MKTVEIRVGSDLHKKLLEAIRTRKKFSASKMDEFKRQWDDADRSMRAYIPEKEIDRKRKDRKRYEGKPNYVTIEVPYVYAQVMSAHSYWCSVFLDRNPVWQFSGRHGETQDAIDAVEAVHDYQARVGGMMPVMFNWIYDWARYNLGIVGLYWEKEVKNVVQFVDQPATLLGIPIPGAKPKKVRKEESIPGYVGNKLYNVRPHNFFPDPRFPVWEFQKGEFCIRETTEGWSEMLLCEQAMPGYYCNLDVLKKSAKEHPEGKDEEEKGSDDQTIRPVDGLRTDISIPGARTFFIEEMYIKLVPSEWGLGDSKKVEIWMLQLADKKTIIRACPLGCYHNLFPFGVLEGNFGSDAFAKQGLIEMIRPMTDVITWLFNTHFYNVRKALNDTRLVDPTCVVIKDLERCMEEEGGIIRLKPEAYGRDVNQFLKQLQTGDATRTHMQDAGIVAQMIQTTSGVVENIMGQQGYSSRRSATESRISSNYAIGRLKTPASYNSYLGFAPIAQMMVANTQQFLDIDRQYAIAGNTLQTAQRYLQVSPESIAGFFDFVPVDGTMSMDPMARATFWKELLLQMARMPNLAYEWDIGGMISHMMKIQGERNIDRFRVRVLPPGTEPGPNGMPVPIGAASGANGKGGKPPGSSGGA